MKTSDGKLRANNIKRELRCWWEFIRAWYIVFFVYIFFLAGFTGISVLVLSGDFARIA